MNNYVPNFCRIWLLIHAINSLVPGRFWFNFRQVIFKLTSVNGGWSISYEIALRWIPLDLTNDKSTLVQVMAWCRQAASHYLSQCWPRSLSPNGLTRPQWVNFYSSLAKQFNMQRVESHQVMHKYHWMFSVSFIAWRWRKAAGVTTWLRTVTMIC